MNGEEIYQKLIGVKSQDIKKVTGRQSAIESLLLDEQAIAEALGIADEEADVREAREDISEFFTKRKSFETILNEEFKRRGIETSTTLLNDLNKIILDQKKALRDLPEDIQRSLEDVGVTQSQLNRAVAKETQGPIEVLRDLLEQRGVLSSEINTAMNFAQAFANTRLADQAVNLSALEFNLSSEKGDLADLEAKKKTILMSLVVEQKEILTLALNNPQANIDVNEDDIQSALDKIAAVPIPVGGELRTIGNQIIRVNEDGTTEVIFEGAAEDDPFTLSRGQLRFDAEGNVIARGAPTGAEDLRTQVVEIGGRKKLVNLDTGDTIRDLGASKAPSDKDRDLPATQTVLLADGAFLPGVLNELEDLIDENERFFGPRFGALFDPISGGPSRIFDKVAVQKAEDDLSRAAQLVGKFMEGGVLRKEDEIKYKKNATKL